MTGTGLKYVILVSITILLAMAMITSANQVEHPQIYNMTTPLSKDPFVTYNASTPSSISTTATKY